MSSISPSSPPTTRSDPASSPFLADLNEPQRAAVTATDGPLLIVAGAGTGKTRVLAHRIAYLLDHVPELTPDRVLAMTFSRKAAEEMRERVEQLLGAHADELQVTTFHSFCYRLLQDHGVEIGLPHRLRSLDRVESWIFLKALLPDLALVHYDSRTDPTSCLDGLLRFISRAKDELVSPEDYARFVGQLEDPDERRRQTEVARVYARYQEALRVSGALDFGDLVMETIRLFRERPAILARYQTRYAYLLVDEFQDTNVAQIELLTTLAARHRNLCVVGDDDQAIYRFRGASYASFLLFQERFPEHRTVRLAQNYRSGPSILRAAERLIRANGEDRYDPQKQLWTERTDRVPVTLLVAQDYDQEAQTVVEQIKALVADMPEADRSYRRIAVLYRAHAQRERLVEQLQREGIPAVVSGGTALFDELIIEDLLALLRVAEDHSDSVSLFRVMTMSIVGVALDDLVNAARAAKQQQRSLYDVLRSPKAVTLPAAARARIRRGLDLLQMVRGMAAREGLEAVTRRLVETVGARPLAYAVADPQAREETLALSRWYRFVRQYLEMHGARRTLAEFLDYVEAYQQAGGDPVEEPASVELDGVQLMTVHQAKGLEFDWVFLIGLVQGRFPSRNRPEAVPFPVELMKERLPAGDFHLQEERRLCYVAMTRARQGLWLVTVERPYRRPSVFVRELAGDPAEDVVRTDLPVPEPGRAVAPGAPAVTPAEEEMVQIVQALKRLRPSEAEAVETYLAQLVERARAVVGSHRPAPPPAIPPPASLTLSFTQVDTYRSCPLKYQYGYVYQIPTKPTPQMQLGNNIHRALEWFGQRLMAGQTPALKELLAFYEETWRSEGYADPLREAKDKAYGRQLLTRYYEVNRERFTPPRFVEKPFLLKVGDVKVRGFIDRIENQSDNRVEIVDFKTGKPKTEVTEGDRLQLNIYAMACRDVLRITPATLSFYYLQTNEKLSFPYEEPALESTVRTITDTAAKIRARAFEPTPDYGKCRVCDFRTICPSSVA